MYDPAVPDERNLLDRRRRKSRAALRQSLLGLIADKPYSAITIEDITEAADVARATFYAHYTDKAALLREACEELVIELGERATVAAAADTPTYSGAATTELLRHAEQNRDLYRLVLSGEGGAAPRNAMIAALQRAVESFVTEFTARFDRQPRVPASLIASTLVGALLLTIEMWLDGRLDGTPADLAAFFARGQVNGLEWALGFEPGDLRYQPRAER